MSVRNVVKTIQDIMRKDAGVDGDAQRISQLCWMFFLKIIDDQDQEQEMFDEAFRSPIPKGRRWRDWAADAEGITGDALLDFVNSDLFPTLKKLEIGGAEGHARAVVRGVFEDAYNYMKSGQLMRQVINKIQEIDFNTLTDRQHFGDIYEQILNDLQSAGNAGEYYTPRAVTAFMADRIDPKPGEILLDPACGTGGFLTCAMRHMKKGNVRSPEDRKRISAGTVRRDGVVAEEDHKLISAIDSNARLQYGLKSGDLLACRFNGNKAFVGRLTIFKDYLGIDPIYPDKLIRVRVDPQLASAAYLRMAGDSGVVRAEIEAMCATTVGNWGISATKLKEIRFPLPPLAEQHRIVAKVEALMALCERLEKSLDAAAATRRRLLDALLAEALAPTVEPAMEAAE